MSDTQAAGPATTPLLERLRTQLGAVRAGEAIDLSALRTDIRMADAHLASMLRAAAPGDASTDGQVA